MFNINEIAGCFAQPFGQFVSIKTPLVVLGGVSGVGKTSVAWALLQRRSNFHLLKTTTTRSPRYTESEDIHYRFITQEMFAQQQAAGEILCCTIWAGNGQAYGLAKSELADNDDQCLQLYASTYFGTMLKTQAPQNVLHIWLTCGDSMELKRRLQYRRTSNSTQAARRWATAVSEQAYVLQHQKQLIAQNQIDVMVDTAYRSVAEVAQEVDAEIGRFLWTMNFPPSRLGKQFENGRFL